MRNTAQNGPRSASPTLGWLVPAVQTGGYIPAAVLVWDALHDHLGANPIQQATHQTGQLAIILLLLSLACTPLRLLSGWLGWHWTWPARLRRPLGLLAFFYALLHFGIYLLDQGFSLGTIWEDVVKRPFVTSGFAALMLLVPLALTSTPKSIKRLGFARWTRLHQLVYLAASLAALHYWWGVKKDHTWPFVAVLVLATLLALRWVPRNKNRRHKAA